MRTPTMIGLSFWLACAVQRRADDDDEYKNTGRPIASALLRYEAVEDRDRALLPEGQVEA